MFCVGCIISTMQLNSRDSFAYIVFHDDVIKWKLFPRYWPFVRRIHRSPVNSPHKGQWRGALMFSLIYAWTNGWVNNGESGDLRRHRVHYDVTVMLGGFTGNVELLGPWTIFIVVVNSVITDLASIFIHMSLDLTTLFAKLVIKRIACKETRWIKAVV